MCTSNITNQLLFPDYLLYQFLKSFLHTNFSFGTTFNKQGLKFLCHGCSFLVCHYSWRFLLREHVGIACELASQNHAIYARKSAPLLEKSLKNTIFFYLINLITNNHLNNVWWRAIGLELIVPILKCIKSITIGYVVNCHVIQTLGGLTWLSVVPWNRPDWFCHDDTLLYNP